MRIVTAEEAVAGIQSGDQIYLHCAAATPSVLLDALVARAPELRDVSVSTSTARARAPTWRPRWRRHFRHRALFIGPNARAAVNEGRADYIPAFLSDVPRLFEQRAAPARRRVRERDARRTPTASARWGPASRRCTPRSGPRRRSSSSSTAPMPRTLGESFIHVDQIDLAVECDVPPYEHAVGEHRRHRAADRRVRRRPRAGRRDDPDGHRGDPVGGRRGAARQARPGRPHRDVHRRRRRPRRGRRDHRQRARSATGARSWPRS